MRNDSDKWGQQKGIQMNTVVITSVLAILPLAANAGELARLPQPLAEKVEVARQACKDNQNGEFALEWGAVTRTDLDGDLNVDWVLNEALFACSSAASLYCGTGGCVSHFLVGNSISSLLNQGWEVISLGHRRVLLADVHGSQCGDINPTPCVTASIWDKDEQKWRSASAQWE